MAPLGFVTGIATLSWIVLLVLLVGIELVSSSTRVTSVKSAKSMEKARQLALVSILAIRPLADVFKLVTWICHWHCHIVLDCPVGIISWY